MIWKEGRPLPQDHSDATAAAMHIVLTVAMHRLGLTELTVTESDYNEAIRASGSLRVQREGGVYRVTRLPHDA